jgi:protein O-mannosyl-transferase
MSLPPLPTAEKTTLGWDRFSVRLLTVILLAAGLFAAYRNSFEVPFLLDDEDSIVKNPSLDSIATALFPRGDSGSTVSGRPLLNLSFALHRTLGADNLAGYHAGNLLIHFIAALCLFGIIRRTLQQPMLSARYAGHATPLAGVAAALWALHPVQTESVTYLIQRAESLVGLCYFFTLYAFIRGVTGPSRAWQMLAVVGCFLGMAAKEVMATVPLVIVLYDRTFVSGTFRDAWRRHRGLHIAFAAGWLLLLALVISSGSRGATVGFSQVGPFEYLFMQGPGIATYLLRSVWPAGLVFDYGAVVEKRPLVLVAGVAVVLALLITTLVQLRQRPAIGFIGAWFFLILAPTSSFIPVATQTLAEHRLYLPLAALTTATALLGYRLGSRIAPLLFGALLLASGAATFLRNHDYRTPITLWEDTVAKVPDNVRALNNLALGYQDAGRLDDAVECLTRAIELAPDFADAYGNLGAVLMKQALRQSAAGRNEALDRGEFFGPRRGGGQRDEAGIARALENLRHACELAPDRALIASLYANALLDAGQTEVALPVFVRAVELEPTSAAYHYDLANLYLRLNRYAEAERHYQESLRIMPESAEVLTNYGLMLRRQHRLLESLERLRTAARIAPQSARVLSNLGVTLLASGVTAEAIRELTTALKLDPRLPQAHYHLANAYAETTRLPEAIHHLEILFKLAPATAELRSNLGVLYARAGRIDDAIHETRLALELDPNHDAARENLERLTEYRAAQTKR